MQTNHKIFIQSAQNMQNIDDNSIDLVVTSPPYPMIEMWDEMFSKQNGQIRKTLNQQNGKETFDLMHRELNDVWGEVYRVLKSGGIACINIGDATRTIDNEFQLYPSHAEIITSCRKLGFSSLPEIIWRKQTNAPNKFMGSGMLPSGAYITLEHEYILIFRKGGKRIFTTDEAKLLRQQSAYFWEERNTWFSDIWEFKGTSQKLYGENIRNRSAAYPFELAYRLINMFSIKNDTILDPFLGTGTTMIAAMSTGRNSINIEIDSNMMQIIDERLADIALFSNEYIKTRIQNHISFIKKWIQEKGMPKYLNNYFNFPVITNQETLLILNFLTEIIKISNTEYEVVYKEENSSDIAFSINPDDKADFLENNTKGEKKEQSDLHDWF